MASFTVQFTRLRMGFEFPAQRGNVIRMDNEADVIERITEAQVLAEAGSDPAQAEAIVSASLTTLSNGQRGATSQIAPGLEVTVIPLG